MDTEPKNWDERLLLVTELAVEQSGTFEDLERFKGLITVLKMGLGNPRIVNLLRAAMADLAAINPESRFTRYMQKTLDIFNREILIGDLIVAAVTGKPNLEAGKDAEQ